MGTDKKPSAIAIGTFDGVHKGHEAVLSTLRDIAEERSLQPVAITFDRHPLSVIAPGKTPPALCTIEKKLDLLRRNGVTALMIPFDENLRSTTSAEWMKTLRNDYNARVIVVGYDNTFGCDGVNLSLADYRDFGVSLGIDIVEAPFIEGVSSSAIRKAVAAGKVEDAARMLGRNFILPGIVVKGNQLGRTIGFPTANLMPLPGITVPAHGVYACTAMLPGGVRKHAVVNIGVRPTVMRGNDLTVEAHILDWEGDIYGHSVSISFKKRLRDEMQFDSINTLKARIAEDARETERIFAIRQK